MTSTPVTSNFRPFELSHTEGIRLRREVSRAAHFEKPTTKLRLNRPTKREKLLQESGLDQATAAAVMAAMKGLK